MINHHEYSKNLSRLGNPQRSTLLTQLGDTMKVIPFASKYAVSEDGFVYSKAKSKDVHIN